MFSFRKKKQTLGTLSSEALFRLYQETKSKDSFGEIYKRYSKLVYGVCLKYIQDKEEARDSMMDVFELLMDKIPEQGNISTIDSWIFSVAKNKSFSKLRKMNKLPQIALDEKKMEKKPEFHMENEGFLRLYNEESQEEDENITTAIEKLNPEQKACIKAFYLNNLSYKEIEEQLGYPLARVKSHLQNGKRNLKVLLQEAQIRT